MMSTLPPLNALRAFEAVGRNLHLSAAASELNVTPGAVSKQLKLLEDHLGRTVCTRGQGGMVLTPEGQVLFDQLSQTFDNLSVAVRNVRQGDVAGGVKIVCATAFVTNWLVQKLGRFNARFADISLTIVPATEGNPFRDASVDIAILFGRPSWSDVNVQLLKRMEFFPVCSPVLLNGPQKIRRPADLKNFMLLDDVKRTHWIEWFASVGQEASSRIRRLCFSDFNHTLAAARAGLGVAMGDNVTVTQDLASGALVRPLADAMRPKNEAYYILTPSRGNLSRPAQAFVDWLNTEMQKSDLIAPPS